MTKPPDVVDAIASGILARPVDQRLEAFAEAMRTALDDLAEQHPRSTPRDLVRMARNIGRQVLWRLRVARSIATGPAQRSAHDQHRRDRDHDVDQADPAGGGRPRSDRRTTAPRGEPQRCGRESKHFRGLK